MKAQSLNVSIQCLLVKTGFGVEEGESNVCVLCSSTLCKGEDQVEP